MKTKFKKPIQIALIACLVLTSVVGSAFAMQKYFEDAKGHWAEDVINALADKGVIAGYPDGLVHPDNIITRSEFAVLIARTMELEHSEETPLDIQFTDIKDHWAEQDINALIAEDIIEQHDYSTEFFPNEPITRYEMIRMLTRSLGEVSHKEGCTHETDFTDLANLTSTQLSHICTAEKYDIAKGFPDGTLRPFWNATRAEAFAMLVNKDHATDKVKQEQEALEEQKKEEIEKPSKPSGGGGSYNPTPVFSFDLPLASYVGEAVTLTPQSSHVSTVAWVVQKDGVAIDFATFFDGSLSANGGTIKAKESGSYTLTATATSSRGKTTITTDTITIYPVVTTQLEIPELSHTDKAVDIELNTQNLGEATVKWTVSKDGAVVNMEDVIDGELDNTGGTVFFMDEGDYTLTATVVDEMGKFITTSDSIKIFPSVDIALSLPSTTHTDKPIDLDLTTKHTEGLNISYTLTHNGKAVKVADYIEGNLTDGDIRFMEKGVYKLTAMTQDETGRTFADTADIVVYPVGTIGFYLPEVFHTDHTVTVEATFTELSNHTVTWTLFQEDKEVSITDHITGTLGNHGGKISMKEDGEYKLKASFTDDGDRSYSYEQNFTVYPVPIVTYCMPDFAHTDTQVSIETTTQDLGNLTVEWLVDNTFGYQDWDTFVDGTLNNEGGTITFKRAGVYELVARVSDDAGRVFLFETGDTIEVFPVLDFGFDLPSLAYTDTTLDFRTHGNNNVLPVDWTLTKDGKAVSFSTVTEGKLNANGGKLRFIEHGSYVLTATMTDYLDREFTHSEEINIMPLVEFSFGMPSEIHFGTDFAVEVENAVHTDLYTVNWAMTKDNHPVSFDGTLSNDSGTISIAQLGDFLLTATITDSEGRVFTHKESITVTNTAPTVTVAATTTRTVQDGKFFVEITATASDADGDSTTLEWDGRTDGDYYTVGTHTIRVRAKDIANTYSQWQSVTFEVVNSAPTVTVTATTTRTVQDGKFFVEITATASDADGDETTLKWDGRTDGDYYSVGTHTVRVRAKDIADTYSDWQSVTFEVVNSAPTVTVTATTTRTVQDGKFFVEITATASDADGDSTTLEWDGRTDGDYYTVGTHTVRVRAKDIADTYSDWQSVTFEVVNSSPSTPVITRSPNGNSVPPNTPITINATATDPDGDTITYIWEGRNSLTQTYPLGRNLVRVKAVDEAGAESPWSAIVFFVADSTNGGGMTLTGPDSTIMENGIEGATITEYTFTVPPVDGHSSNQDYGRVRGFNKNTQSWEQLNYKETRNGVTLTGTLQAGVYTRLELYYFTDHDCMYNESNITYSVEYFFE